MFQRGSLILPLALFMHVRILPVVYEHIAAVSIIGMGMWAMRHSKKYHSMWKYTEMAKALDMDKKNIVLAHTDMNMWIVTASVTQTEALLKYCGTISKK